MTCPPAEVPPRAAPARQAPPRRSRCPHAGADPRKGRSSPRCASAAGAKIGAPKAHSLVEGPGRRQVRVNPARDASRSRHAHRFREAVRPRGRRALRPRSCHGRPGRTVPSPVPAPRCYLFNCTARGRSVCKFAPLRGYRTYTLSRAGDAAGISPGPGEDEPPVSRAGKDVVLRLPTDGVVLDGRESTDDHAIVLYEWTLQQGDPSSVDMKVPQPGTLKLSHLKEGAYVFQLTVTDSVGQRSSDNVSVTVLPRLRSTGGCSSACSRYHFFCDNGCCIDIALACDGVRQCPDGSDEDFCQNLALDRKLVTHTVATSAQPGATGLNEGEGDPWLEKSQKATTHNQPATVSHPEKRIQPTQKAPESQINPVQPDSNSSGKNQEEKYDLKSKSDQARGEHPAPEAGAVLPLALGLAITALLLLMVTCRLRLVKQKLKKARPITSEESDYLINGMYL